MCPRALKTIAPISESNHPLLATHTSMNIINFIPSPPQALRLTISLLNSSILGQYRTTAPTHNPADYDVHLNTETGFLPPKPVPHLPAYFDIWENALEDAQESVTLGEHELDPERVASAAAWRSRITSVRGLSGAIRPNANFQDSGRS